ncbi:MAG: type II secretion system GspH family protein [Lachnospiraceae bacterium]|nr:type II secretion system GspH family protein [Lachnospiraceae bacterium]
MIVVILILAILASAAVYGISAYIDLTRYNNNQENAISIFQSAQLAVNHMEASGTAEELALRIIGTNNNGGNTSSPFNVNNSDPDKNDAIFRETYFDAFPDPSLGSNPGQSVHMRYALTYTPSATDEQSSIVHDLISNDFKSTDIFSGIITIEFDVEKVLNSTGELHYSVNVYSVFYDSRRTSWDAVSMNNKSSVVPFREEEYRRSDSLIGYYYGANASATVDTVYIPSDEEIKNTIFTLRNGETLDLTWSATADNKPVTGRPAHIHYQFSLYDSNTDKKFCDLIVNENSLLGGIPSDELANKNNAEDTFYDRLQFGLSNDPGDFVEGFVRNVDVGGHQYTAVDTSEVIKNEKGIEVKIYRRTIHTTALVFIHRGSDEFNYSSDSNWSKVTSLDSDRNCRYYEFPFAISYEVHAGDGISDRISYSLSLDAMMSLNVMYNAENQDTAVRTLNYSISRLVPQNISAANLSFRDKLPATNQSALIYPLNIYAKMVVAPDAFDSHPDYNDTTGFPVSETFTAERALDDPIYKQTEGKYDYVYTPHLAYQDDLRHCAVVNTYFGDLKFGTFFGDNSDRAIITSYRHLSNTRLLRRFNSRITYAIVRDLDWYTIEKNSLGEEVHCSSEVAVYSLKGDQLVRHSPVEICYGKRYGDMESLSVVSFPAIQEVHSLARIVAEENDISPLPPEADRTASINNVQMRMPSFYSSQEDGYGLICVNYGTVVNIHANGITLTLDELEDGSPDDRAQLVKAIDQMINGDTLETTVKSWKPSSPVGGLIGANNGYVGARELDINDSNNIIRFSNCLIMPGEWLDGKWQIDRVSACSVVVGDNNGNQYIRYNDTNPNRADSMYGRIEVTGNYVSAGCIYVGTAIGYCKSNVDAFISVDNTADTDKAQIDITDHASSLVFGMSDVVGGAVGSIDEHRHFLQTTGSPLSYAADDEGRVIITENADPQYAIDVNLDEKSVIMLYGEVEHKNNVEIGVGGAVGRLDYYDNTDAGECILSIRVVNKGTIISSKTEIRDYVKDVGGAVGYIREGRISRAYVYVENSGYIGTTAAKCNAYDVVGYSYGTGGAIGHIHNMTSDNGQMIISSVNSGYIYGKDRPNSNSTCVGGAVGSITGSTAGMPMYYISSINRGRIYGDARSIEIYDSGDGTDTFGIGGAVGYLQYLPVSSSVYCSMLGGAEIYSSGNNAGGAVGSQTESFIRDPGTSFTTITADLAGGSSVVSAGCNAGGVIGNEKRVNHHMRIRANITGVVSINAFSNAGGVMGRMKPNDATRNSYIILKGSAGAILNVKASNSIADAPSLNEGTGRRPNENAGGVIGLLAQGWSDLGCEFIIPSQSGADTLVVNVDSCNNSGGMIGKFINSSHNIETGFNLILHPESTIHAVNDNAGGIIGLMEVGNNREMTLEFRSDLSVASATALSSTAFPRIRSDHSNSGGIIGCSTKNFTMTDDAGIEADLTKVSVTGVSNVGGCIGYIYGGPVIGGSIATKGSGNIVISGTDNIGGCIGKLDNSTLNGSITFSAGSASAVPGTPVSTILGTSYVGGCIGKAWNLTVNSAGTIDHSSLLSSVTGQTYVGGCIGETESSTLYGRIIYSGSDAAITGTQYVGGCIGQIHWGTNAYVESLGLVLFSGDRPSISGQDYVGGCIGNTEAGKLYGSISFTSEAGKITGNQYTGGCIGRIHGGNPGSESAAGHIAFSGKNNEISGSAYTGGCVGYIYDIDKLYNNVSFSGQDNKVSGTTYSGGCAGCINNVRNFYGKLYFSGTGNELTGSGDDTGGIAGAIVSSNMRSGAVLQYSAATSGITGVNNTGGIIGRISGGSASKGYTYRYAGVRSSITGHNNVGGIVGLSDNTTHNYPDMVLAPLNECTINGTGNNIGGIAGLVKKGGSNFQCYPRIDISECRITITGNGYTGGIVGEIGESTGYWGSDIVLKNNSVLNVNSTASSAGGHIGHSAFMTIGKDGHLTTACSGASSISVTAQSASGGFVGYNDGKIAPNEVVLNMEDSGSRISIAALGLGAGAGGYCGINNYSIGRLGGSLSFCSGNGSIVVNASNGYAGGVLGINNRVFGGIDGNFNSNNNNSVRFIINNLTLTSGLGSTDSVLGVNNSSAGNVKYTIA